jgi:hypothetical protein
MNQLKFIKTDNSTIVKNGRKKFAEVTYNKNPDYKYCIWLNRICLSGYETEEIAYNRVNSLYQEQLNLISHLRAQINN